MKGHLCVFEGVCVCVCVCLRECVCVCLFLFCFRSWVQIRTSELTHSLTLTRVCYGVVAQGSISPTCYKQLFVQKCFVQIFVLTVWVWVFFLSKVIDEKASDKMLVKLTTGSCWWWSSVSLLVYLFANTYMLSYLLRPTSCPMGFTFMNYLKQPTLKLRSDGDVMISATIQGKKRSMLLLYGTKLTCFLSYS